ncbi:hypothetical protein ACHAWF_003458 [Thalassiosira exigua]
MKVVFTQTEDACANCGRPGNEEGILRNCTACYLVKYCTVECQKAHRKQHKNECRRCAEEREKEKLQQLIKPAPAEQCVEASTEKLCCACNQHLHMDRFSAKQWHIKKRRRCKECISTNRGYDIEEKLDPSAKAAKEKVAKDKEILERVRVEERKCNAERAKKDMFESEVLDLIQVTEPNTPPSRPECPLCMHILPPSTNASIYTACCGQILCRACFVGSSTGGGGVNPEAMMENLGIQNFLRGGQKKMHYRAMYELGLLYLKGHDPTIDEPGSYRDGTPRRGIDHGKAIECFQEAASMGRCEAFYQLALIHEENGQASEYVNYLHKAAEGGNLEAIRKFAQLAMKSEEMEVAMAHYKVLAIQGCDKEALKQLQIGYQKGFVPKDELESIMRAHQESLNDVKSNERAYMNRLASGRSDDGKIVESDVYL